MIKQHIILSGLWILYCVLHSVLADMKVKSYVEKLMGASFKYYRIIYSIFAAISLVGILYMQFSIDSHALFSSIYLIYAGIIVLIIPGLIIMAICIKKYFYELSGIQALHNEPLHITLQQKGLHKYMRHPLYSGTLMFAWGLFCVFPLLSNLLACGIMTIYVLIGIKYEEQKLRIEFGDEYIQYSKKVNMLIPGVL